MLDVRGNKRVIRQQGKLGPAKHVNILSALERRALWFSNREQPREAHDEVLYREVLDETGTVETTDLSDSDANSLEEEYEKQFTITTTKQEEMRGIEDEVMEVHGWAPGRKAEGTTRFIYENCDGLSNSIGGNDKLDKAKELIDDLEADVVAYNEHKINFSQKLNRNGMSQMFNGGECEVRSVAAHNVHEKEGGRTQEGGTSMLLRGVLIQQYDFEASG
jgi:hypothetical protein